ncbi:MAG: hypothetical protein ACI9SC_003364 [Gammaproteobacteria bacterium]
MKPVLVICATFLMIANAYSERCATPEEVRERLISADYEWSVNEEVSLDGLLAVKNLYAVTIENYGEFVACKYEGAQEYIRLDGASKKSKCPIQATSDNWFISEGGQVVCDEDDNALCRFDSICR